jgi:hypothetical protein
MLRRIVRAFEAALRLRQRIGHFELNGAGSHDGGTCGGPQGRASSL